MGKVSAPWSVRLCLPLCVPLSFSLLVTEVYLPAVSMTEVHLTLKWTSTLSW